jgi:hypothetical protein
MKNKSISRTRLLNADLDDLRDAERSGRLPPGQGTEAVDQHQVFRFYFYRDAKSSIKKTLRT